MTGTPHAPGASLLPVPDAEEYALLALRLARGEAPLITVAGHEYPSRYSLACPALLAPAAALLRGDAAHLWLAAALFGLLATGLMARTAAWMLGSRAAGGLAAAFFALHPQTAVAGSTVMSETAILMMFFIMLELARPWLAQCGMRSRSLTGTSHLECGIKNSESRIQNSEDGIRGLLRAGMLGLVLAWLTLAKAPFAWWTLAITALVTARAVARRSFGPAAALIGAGLACAAGDMVYRCWAFGQWGMNGYQYWAPEFYREFLKTFNWSYLWRSYSELRPEGNLEFYGRMLLGMRNEFFGRYMAPVAAAGAAGLAWRWLKNLKNAGAEARTTNVMIFPLMAGWAVVGVLFCGFYFYQEARFPFLWIPLVDLAAAWALVCGVRGLKGPKRPDQVGHVRQSPKRLKPDREAALKRAASPETPAIPHRLKPGARKSVLKRAKEIIDGQSLTENSPGSILRQCLQVAGVLVALLILRGEYRRVRDVIHTGLDPALVAPPAPVATLRPLLAQVPPGAWLFTNFKPVSVDLARPQPGPTGSLYVRWLDGIWPLMNTHALGIESLGLQPRRTREPGSAELQKLPGSWENKPAQLIGMDGQWNLAPEERREFFNRPVYALVVRPALPPDVGNYLDETIMPRLREDVTLTTAGAAGDATLYRMERALPSP